MKPLADLQQFFTGKLYVLVYQLKLPAEELLWLALSWHISTQNGNTEVTTSSAQPLICSKLMRPFQAILDQTDPVFLFFFVFPLSSLLMWAAWAWPFVSLRHKQRLPYGVHADSATFLSRWGPLGLIWVWSRQGVALLYVLLVELTEVAILLFCCSKGWMFYCLMCFTHCWNEHFYWLYWLVLRNFCKC